MRTSSVVALSIAVVVGFFTMSAVFGSFYTIDEGERGVLLTNGAVSDVVQPGLHFKFPFVQSVQHINTRTAFVEWGGQNALVSYSHDQQPTHLALKLTYRVLPDDESIKKLYSSYKDRDGFEVAIIWPSTAEAVKTVFGKFTAVSAIQNRTALNAQVFDAVKAAVKGPVEIMGVQITNIDYSKEYEDAVEAQMKALVEIQKTANNLEMQKKLAEIKVVQAQAEATRLREIGNAQADAINARGKALRDNPALVELVAAEKWDGKLPTTMPPHGTVPFLSLGKP